MKKNSLRHVGAVVSMVLCCLALTACTQEEEIRWQDRVLPLPQEMAVDGHATVRARDIAYAIRAQEDAPPFETVRFLFDAFAHGEVETAKVVIELVLVDETPGAVPAELRARLKAVPNAWQAYAIFPRETAPRGLTIAANTPVGLLYGAHTLRQMIRPGQWDEAAGPDEQLPVPAAQIVDWPAINLRGTRASAAHNTYGWASQWKVNFHSIRLRAGHDKLVSMGKLDSDRVRDWVQWMQRIGYRFVPGLGHMGHIAAQLDSVSPAVYTEENPAPANRLARGFCWAPGQEIYSILEKRLRTSADITYMFPKGERIIEAQLTEHEGTSCYCPDCDGANGYIMETEALLGIFQKLKADYPDLKIVLMLSQGSRPVNDEIIRRISEVPDAGVSYYDGRYTYRMYRSPMIPEPLEAFSRKGGLVDVCMTITPGHWHTHILGSVPHYVRDKAQEFAEKQIESVAQYDMVGGAFYWPMTIAAWGEYLWNPDGRSVKDFARAYATIAGIAKPDLFARWADKAGEAAYELGISQYMGFQARAAYSFLPEVIAEDAFQEESTIRLAKALRDAREALRLARMAGEDFMLWESEFTLAALKSLALRLELQEMLQSRDQHEEAVRLLEQLDDCARITVAVTYPWHDQAMENRDALADAPGFLAPPELLSALPRVRDLDRFSPFWTQWRSWHTIQHAGDTEWMTALMAGLPDTRGEWAPVEIADWEEDDFEDGRLTLELDLTDRIEASGGHYLLKFELEEGVGNHLEIHLTGTRRETGETRVIHQTHVTNWHGRRAADAYADFLLRIPERSEDEMWTLKAALRAKDRSRLSSGFVTIRRAWAWDEIPPEAVDRLLEE